MTLATAARILPLIGVLSGCGGVEREPVEQGTEAGGQPVAVAAPPRSVAELAPGDTLGMLQLMRALMSSGNQLAATLERSDTTMPSDGYREPRTLSLWRQDGLPVKLVATEPNEDGLMRLETVTWFAAGDIAVIQEPFAVLMFDADRLVMWTDEAMEPVAAPEGDRMDKERAAVDSARARLKAFGITYP